MTTTTFKRAIQVSRDEAGGYEIFGRDEPWSVLQEAAEKIDVLGELAGWGQWTHVVRVDFGFNVRMFFVR